MRVMSQFHELEKGRMTADQFETVWVNLIMELDSLGISKNPRTLYLAYLSKAGRVGVVL